MLRITVCKSPGKVSFQLEGSLSGPWVKELEKCWQQALASQSEPTVSIDLAGVTFIDDEGKRYLAAMNSRGTQLVGGDCVTKAIVEEIRESTGKRPKKVSRLHS
jgi:anti-anti-sigma regulatory factor